MSADDSSASASGASASGSSASFSVAGRWNPNAGKSSDAVPVVKSISERSAAIAALAKAAPVVAARVETPAELYASTLSKISITIDGVTHPFSFLQEAKKGKDGPLSCIDFDLKHSYLSEDDFKIVFSMSFDDFDKLPAWKQKSLREKAKLF